MCQHLVPSHLPPSPLSSRFAFTSYRPYATQLREIQSRHAAARDASGSGSGGAAMDGPPLLPATVPGLDPAGDDAFHTVMAWLHSRIPSTRRPPP